LYAFTQKAFDEAGIKELVEQKLVGITADGASNMQDIRNGLLTQYKRNKNDIITVHCLAHRLEQSYCDAIKAVPVIEKKVMKL